MPTLMMGIAAAVLSTSFATTKVSAWLRRRSLERDSLYAELEG